MPIENVQEFRSDGAWNLSIYAQFAYQLTKWPRTEGPSRKDWLDQEPSNGAVIS